MATRKKAGSRQLNSYLFPKHRTQAGASAIAAGMLILSAQAYAAEVQQATNPADAPLEEVVVTAIRKSLQSSQEIKKNATEVVDSITAVDIGALPDRSVSEALQRIPGITLQRTNANRDPARMASEGGGVFIRGLSWVRSETNGRDVFSANNGRDLSFEDVSADLLAGVDVYKNPSAEHIEGGIGGIVDLRMRKPFDSDKQIIAGSLDYNHADLLDDSFTSGNLLYSNNWDSGIGRIGLLAAVSVGNIGNRTDSIQTGRYVSHALTADEATAVGMTAGDTVYMPNSWGFRSIDWQQQRKSLDIALQWAPTDELTFTLSAFGAQADPKDIEHTVGDGSGRSLGTIDSSYKFGSDGVLQSGIMSNPQIGGDTRYGESHKVTKDFSFNIDYRPSDKWTVTGDFQYVTSHSDVLSLTAFTQLTDAVDDGDGGTIPTSQVAFDLHGNTPKMNIIADPAFLADPANYWWAAAMDHIEKNDAHSWAQRADAEYKFDDNPWLTSLRFGVRSTDKQATTRQTGWNWGFLSHQFWGGGPADYLDSGLTPASASSFRDYDGFMRGSVSNPGMFWLPSDALVNQGNGHTYDILRATETSGWGWSPVSTDWGNTTINADNGNRGINDQHERTKALYTTLRFAHDSFMGPMDGNVGVRVVRTDVDALATPGIQASTGTALVCTSPNAVDPRLREQHERVPLGIRRTDPDLRGSLHGRVAEPEHPLPPHRCPATAFRCRQGDLASDVQPDAGYDVALGELADRHQRQRHAERHIGRLCVLDARSEQGCERQRPDGYWRQSTAQTTGATQFDTSLEWYFAPAGSLTGAIFYKDIKDDLFAGQVHETTTRPAARPWTSTRRATPMARTAWSRASRLRTSSSTTCCPVRCRASACRRTSRTWTAAAARIR
ncbi:MAG: TonB-dependent receptor [Vicinamibacterales bacterium]